MNRTRFVLLVSSILSMSTTVLAHEGKPHHARDLLFTWGLDPLVIASLALSGGLLLRRSAPAVA